GHPRLIRPCGVTPLMHQYGETVTAPTREDGPVATARGPLNVEIKPRPRRPVEGTFQPGRLNSNMAVFSCHWGGGHHARVKHNCGIQPRWGWSIVCADSTLTLASFSTGQRVA